MTGVAAERSREGQTIQKFPSQPAKRTDSGTERVEQGAWEDVGGEGGDVSGGKKAADEERGVKDGVTCQGQGDEL